MIGMLRPYVFPVALIALALLVMYPPVLQAQGKPVCSRGEDWQLCLSAGGKTSLDILPLSWQDDAGKWQPAGMIISKDKALYRARGRYNLTIDPDAGTVSVERNGEYVRYSLPWPCHDVIVKGDTLSCTPAIPGMDARIVIRAEPAAVRKQIIIDSVTDAGLLPAQFSYSEAISESDNAAGVFGQSPIVMADADGKSPAYSTALPGRITFESSWLAASKKPIVIDPDLIIMGGLTLSGNYTYDTITVWPNSTLTIDAYDGTPGTGSLSLIGLQNVTVYGTIEGRGRGWRGGAGGLHASGNGAAGEGPGSGGAGTGTGPGAGHGSASDGPAYGYTDDPYRLMGSGGSGGKATTINDGGPGSGGGASIRLYSPLILVSGQINMSADAPAGAMSTDGFPGGGGSGGMIYINGNVVNLSYSKLHVRGGDGQQNENKAVGGSAGSGGRIKVFYNTLYNASASYDIINGTGGHGNTGYGASGGPGTIIYNAGSFGEFPFDPKLDFLNDGIMDWQYRGVLNSSMNVSLNSTALAAMTAWLHSSCPASWPNGLCTIPVNVTEADYNAP